MLAVGGYLPRRIEMQKWQLGYRLHVWVKNNPMVNPRMNTSYVDLPEFDADKRTAYRLLAQLQDDFAAVAEWRLVESC
jgi:hypothetical protein